MSSQNCCPSRGGRVQAGILGQSLLEVVKKEGWVFIGPLGDLVEFVKIYNFVGHCVHAL
jgi:hypothetical protein